MKINPRPTKFIIFSGGGGMLEREQKVRLHSGKNKLDIEEVPAAFDPSTTMVYFPEPDPDVSILQVDVKRPDKNIVQNFISREKNAASQIIKTAVDLRGSNRDQIIQLIESAHYRRYEDMTGSITVSLESKAEKEIALGLRYFLEDSRIKWEPSLHISIDEKTGTANIEGFILVMNNTDMNYPQCEVGFAEFDMEYTSMEDGYLEDLEEEQEMQSAMPKKRMMAKMGKMTNLLM